jgi:hypothetical protein
MGIIGVSLVDEDGNEVRRAKVSPLGLDELLRTMSTAKGSRCLRFVDDTGDTIFNRLQLPVLAAELGWLRAVADSADAMIAIDEILHLVSIGLAEPHLYLKFRGD